MLCAAFGATAEAKLYKWVDDQGETHYGEVIPPEYANKEKVQIEKGLVVKDKDKDKASDSESIDPGRRTAGQQADIEQHRRDKALVNTYSSEKEIDLARDRNLRQVEARINGIHMMQKTAQDSLDDFNREAKEAKQAGKPIPASLQADIAAAQGKTDKLKRELTAAEEKEASVKVKFEADKVRYRELMSGENK